MEATATSVSPIGSLLSSGALSPAFQPVIDLAGGEVTGYEALARAAPSSELQNPADMFAAARAAGRLVELDVACQAAALQAALDAGLAAPLTLFVNIEPQATGALPEHLRRLYAEACAQMRVVVEVTERALTSDPADLLARVSDMRALGCQIALDDVGAEVGSLAMMAFLEPDVIKVDLALVQRRPDAETAMVITAVGAEAERTGAVVLVEGIETAEHRDTAFAMGATLGQGWHFGRPGRLPAVAVAPGAVERPPRRRALAVRTPYELTTAAGLATRVSTKPLLFAISKHLENQGRAAGAAAVLLATFQTAELMTPATRRRYARIALEIAYCASIGEDMEPVPAPGVIGVALESRDPLVLEWDLVVISPHFAAALVARDLVDDGPESERRFAYSVSYDRTLAVAAAQSLMSRIPPR